MDSFYYRVYTKRITAPRFGFHLDFKLFYVDSWNRLFQILKFLFLIKNKKNSRWKKYLLQNICKKIISFEIFKVPRFRLPPPPILIRFSPPRSIERQIRTLNIFYHF